MTALTQASATGTRRSDLDLLVRYEDAEMIGLSPSTVAGRQGALLRFAQWLAPRSLLEATTGDVEAWTAQLAPSTRAGRVGQLHAFYNWCLNEGEIDRDPTGPLVRLRRALQVGDLPQLLHGWWIAQERRNLARSTMETRARLVRRFHDAYAPRSILDATAADIEAWLDTCALAPKGRYAAISNLSMFYKWARRQEMVTADPTESIDRPRLPQGVPRPIRDDDLALAVDRADNTTRAMLCLAAYAGLRAKEIAGLCREDILETMDAPTLVVTAPKGRRQRTVPLHPALWDALRAAGLPRSGYLFRQRSGLAVPAWKVSQVVNDHLRSLGIDSTLHKLRHHFATKVYAASLDLRLTQELLGHSSPTTTAMYTAYNRTQAVDVVGRLTIGSHRRSA